MPFQKWAMEMPQNKKPKHLASVLCDDHKSFKLHYAFIFHSLSSRNHYLIPKTFVVYFDKNP